MKKKIYCFIIALALGLSGCGIVVTETETISTQNEIKGVEVIDKKIELSAEYKESLKREVTEWSLAYANYIESLEGASWYNYMLIYLDKDDVPELFVSTECEAGGEIVATYYHGEVKTYQLSRLGTQYIAYSGLMYTDTGHMDYYPVYITRLENGMFNKIADGTFTDAVCLEGLSDYYAPDYDYSNSSGSVDIGEKDCGIVKYYDSNSKIYVFEAADNLIEVLPELSGKVGYICEFDN